MPQMIAAQIRSPGAPFEVVKREIPAPEVAGVVDEVGTGVSAWKKGQRVGVDWHGGHCGQGDPCRRGDFMGCRYFQVSGSRKTADTLRT
jgi:D-arabinose 1-dehydrogenase-like Zn-dependent alcohol dehydrogenase